MWLMWWRPSVGPLASRATSTASSASRTARSPIAWKWTWKPAASSSGVTRRSRSGSTNRIPVRSVRPPSGAEVRLEHRPGERLEDAVDHDLDRRRPVPADRSGGPPLDELVDPALVPVALPPQRADDPCGELPASGHGDVGRLVERLDDRVLPGGDPERMELGLSVDEAVLDLGLAVRAG